MKISLNGKTIDFLEYNSENSELKTFFKNGKTAKASFVNEGFLEYLQDSKNDVEDKEDYYYEKIKQLNDEYILWRRSQKEKYDYSAFYFNKESESNLKFAHSKLREEITEEINHFFKHYEKGRISEADGIKLEVFPLNDHVKKEEKYFSFSKATFDKQSILNDINNFFDILERESFLVRIKKNEELIVKCEILKLYGLPKGPQINRCNDTMLISEKGIFLKELKFGLYWDDLSINDKDKTINANVRLADVGAKITIFINPNLT